MRNGKCLYCNMSFENHNPEICQRMSDGTEEKKQLLKVLYEIDNSDLKYRVAHKRLLLDLLLDLGYEDNKEKEIKRAFTAGYSWGISRDVEDCFLDWKSHEEEIK